MHDAGFRKTLFYAVAVLSMQGDDCRPPSAELQVCGQCHSPDWFVTDLAASLDGVF